MTWLAIVVVIILFAAALLTAIRVGRGPTMLDRMVGMDIMLTVVIVALAADAAWNRRTDTIPILMALALVGFVGSVTVARFAPQDSDRDTRILSAAEAAAADAKRRREEVAEAAAEGQETEGLEEDE